MKESNGFFWWQKLGFCIRLRGFFWSAGNVISHERHTWFILTFQGRFQSHFNLGRSSVGSAHCRLVWKACSQRGEIKPAPASLWSGTLGHWHGSPEGLQPLYLAPRIGHRACLDPLSNIPAKYLPLANFQHDKTQPGQLCLCSSVVRKAGTSDRAPEREGEMAVALVAGEYG